MVERVTYRSSFYGWGKQGWTLLQGRGVRLLSAYDILQVVELLPQICEKRVVLWTPLVVEFDSVELNLNKRQ